MSHGNQYIPAFRFGVLTPLFDPMMRWIGRELSFKRRLVQEAHLTPEARVLDLGCGTGTLTLLIKEMHPATDVVGIDGDPDVLAIARAKTRGRAVDIQFDQGMAFELPYADASFDRVLSSLMFHHLTARDKERTLAQVWRVLKPGGELLIVDFGKPQNGLAWVIAQVLQRLEPTGDLNRGLLLNWLATAGLERVGIVTHFMTAFGTLALYRGRKPGG